MLDWKNKDVGQFDVPEGVVFRQISSGAEHVCGLDDVGLIHCWGAGQSDLGVSPDFGQSIVPAGVFTKVVSGDYHSCGQDEEGYVTCWGNAEDGRLDVPETVFLDFDIGGQHGCGFDIYGDLVCWGSDVFDQST